MTMTMMIGYRRCRRPLVRFDDDADDDADDDDDDDDDGDDDHDHE